jgi:tetratricopeptide (TPR) repeat protein
MLYIYIELRYLRQLNRICPEVTAAFFSGLSVSARRNGASELRTPSGYLFGFDDDSVGYTFAASRVLADLRSLLGDNRVRIRECFALVDRSDSVIDTDSVPDFIAPYATVVKPDECILVTPHARDLLDPYVSFVPLQGTAFFLYSGQRIAEYAAPDRKSGGDRPDFILYADSARDPVIWFRDMLAGTKLPDPERHLPEVERSAYTESCHAMDIFSRFRFSARQPEYRIAACLDWLCFVFRMFESEWGRPVSITLYENAPLPQSFNEVIGKLGDVCEITIHTAPACLPVDLKNIPDDLFDLSYLAYRCMKYLYRDELIPFFGFLGKEPDFLAALGRWMYSFGLLADPGDFRSMPASLGPRIEACDDGRKARLDRHIASYLWLMHEKGLLLPEFALLAVFDELGFTVPDSFIVSCLYRMQDPASGIEGISSRFSSTAVAGAVARTEKAIGLYDRGAYDESSVVAKDVLHVFQSEKILPGEYRALSLLAMLSFARNGGNDAIVYLEYALENAESMHDPYASLSTRFDMATVYFIIGNFHFALCALDDVEKTIESCYAKDWEVLLLFMKGRIIFSLGDYRNAELLFQTAASLASVNQIPESVSLCRVWYARSLVHQSRFASAENILVECLSSVPEAYIYLLESALLSGRQYPGAAFPDQLPVSRDRITCCGPEKISWKSSFAAAEDRCYGNDPSTNVGARLYEAMLIAYRIRFVPGTDVRAGMDRLSVIARVAIECSDPYAAMYYYFCYDLGTRSADMQASDTTVFLSRAFKYMQKRANEIEDNSLREQFMQNPTWNSRLYRVARDNMFI